MRLPENILRDWNAGVKNREAGRKDRKRAARDQNAGAKAQNLRRPARQAVLQNPPYREVLSLIYTAVPALLPS